MIPDRDGEIWQLNSVKQCIVHFYCIPIQIKGLPLSATSARDFVQKAWQLDGKSLSTFLLDFNIILWYHCHVMTAEMCKVVDTPG